MKTRQFDNLRHSVLVVDEITLLDIGLKHNLQTFA